jgi:hypothetical protein
LKKLLIVIRCQYSVIRRPQKIALSPADSDVIYKLEAIAVFCGLTVGQASPLVDTGVLPTFRLPGSTVLCASKSSIRDAWHQYEREWRDKHPINVQQKLRQRKQKRAGRQSCIDHPNALRRSVIGRSDYSREENSQNAKVSQWQK